MPGSRRVSLDHPTPLPYSADRSTGSEGYAGAGAVAVARGNGVTMGPPSVAGSEPVRQGLPSLPRPASHYMSSARRLIKRETKSDGWQHIRAKIIDHDGHVHLEQLEESPATTFRSRGSSQQESLEISRGRSSKDYGSTEALVPPRSRGVSKASALGATKKGPSDLQLIWRVIIGSYLNLLLLFLPFGYLSTVLNWGPAAIFSLNFLGLIPLAAMLGDFTEEIADHTGETLGGLINATFGNAVEMVIGIQALYHNEIRVVQASMLGSVLSNLLLVTGSCFFFGGLRNKEQHFNAVAGVANLSLLFLATLALIIPSPMGGSYHLSPAATLMISRVAALCLLTMYIQLVVFQLCTHRHLFADEEEDDTQEDHESDDEEGGHMTAGGCQQCAEAEPDDEDDGMSFAGSLMALMVTTLLIAFFSNMLVTSIDGLTKQYKIGRTFLGVILLPIVGNATEHLTAVTVAIRDRMELAMGIAIGSATQVSIFVIPFLVIAGWLMGRPMGLDFSSFEVAMLIMAVIITMPMMLTGSSHWLSGSLLITTYLFIAFAFWFEDTPRGEQ